ncbi:MAG: hypothetical protein JXM70_05840 [Pirellulales bacterium]|nr:hypothetical protein [Pirellulales bacterium]
MKVRLIVAFIATLSAAHLQADIMLIGPGSDIGATQVDGDGARLNITRVATNLTADAYNVVEFSVDTTGTSGVVRPFLAIQNGLGPAEYQTVWVGPQFIPTSDGIHSISYTPGFQKFSLASAADIYAGVYHNGTSKVMFNTVPTVTDHDGSPTEPTAAGETIDGFSNEGLNNRTYAYEIGVEPARLIGAGTSIAHNTVDTHGGGPRLNVDDSFTLELPAGTYSATNFSCVSGQIGLVTPFLAKLTSDSLNYQVLALGDTVDVTSTEIQTLSGAFGGDNVFTLTEMTTIYAGITNPTGSDNPVRLQNASGFTTDHDSTPVTISSVGQLLALSDFNNLDLQRTYAFSITVVPEPSMLLLVAMGMLSMALFGHRPRR